MSWEHYSCEISGRPAQVLVDGRFAAATPGEQLPHLWWCAVYCKLPAGDGFWDPDETAALDAVEGDLLRLTERFGHGWAAYVLRLATPGIREYYIYHADAAEVDEIAGALRTRHPDYRIEAQRSEDRGWNEYRKYVSFTQAET